MPFRFHPKLGLAGAYWQQIDQLSGESLLAFKLKHAVFASLCQACSCSSTMHAYHAGLSASTFCALVQN